VCVDEDIFLRDIERLTKHPIAREVIPGFEPDPSERAEPSVLGRMTIGIGGTKRHANVNGHGQRNGGGGGRSGSGQRSGGGGGFGAAGGRGRSGR
jgi:ATP-dependent RNA helicase RhlE